MAFIDDRDWVLSHIRHCFITSDESGFCEQVLGKDEEWDRILNDVGRKKRLDHFHSYAYGKEDGAEGRILLLSTQSFIVSNVTAIVCNG